MENYALKWDTCEVQYRNCYKKELGGMQKQNSKNKNNAQQMNIFNENN